MSDFDCPYCGREYEADYDETISANFSRTCTECHKEFKVEVEVQPVFYSYASDEKKEQES
jgi:transposase-like protein